VIIKKTDIRLFQKNDGSAGSIVPENVEFASTTVVLDDVDDAMFFSRGLPKSY
jgi:hypothetical protein